MCFTADRQTDTRPCTTAGSEPRPVLKEQFFKWDSERGKDSETEKYRQERVLGEGVRERKKPRDLDTGLDEGHRVHS